MRLLNPLLCRLPNPLQSQWFFIPRLRGGEQLLLVAIIASVLLDILNNVLQYLGAHSSAIAILKGLILILVVGSFRTWRSYITTLGLLSVFALRELWVVICESDFYPKDDTVFFLRILSFVTWLLLFYEKRHEKEFLRCVIRIFVLTVVLSVLCQVAGALFNLEFFKAYEDQRGGYKGLFFAENDTSVFYLVSLIHSIFLWRLGKRLLGLLSATGLLLLAAGSKTALIGTVIVPFIYFYFAKRFRSPLSITKLTIRTRLAVLWMIAIIGIATIGYFGVRYLNDILFTINYEQLIRVYEESGLLSSLLSYRDVKVLAYFHSLRSVPDLLFGLQVHNGFRDFGAKTPGDFMYEIDAFDYLARVGLIGSILTFVVIWKTAMLRNWRTATPALKTLCATILLLGCTVGHTLISSLNSIWIAFWLVAFGGAAVHSPAPTEGPPKLRSPQE